MDDKLRLILSYFHGENAAFKFNRQPRQQELDTMAEFLRELLAAELGVDAPNKKIIAAYRTVAGERAAVHSLKTAKQPWQDILDNRKRTEYRYCGDRDFKVGDWLEFVCLNTKNEIEEYSPKMHAKILHIQYGGKFGIPQHHCIMTIGDPVGWGGTRKVCMTCDCNPCVC